MCMSVRPRHYPRMGKIMVFYIKQQVDIRLYISCAMIIGVVKPLYGRELRLSACKPCSLSIFPLGCSRLEIAHTLPGCFVSQNSTKAISQFLSSMVTNNTQVAIECIDYCIRMIKSHHQNLIVYLLGIISDR